MPRIVSGNRETAIDNVIGNAMRAAGGLDAMGFVPGDAIAFFMRNDFPLFEAAQAASFLGVYAVPINWHYTAEEANYVLNDCGAKALLIHADLLRGIESGIPDGVQVFVVETPDEIAASYGGETWVESPPSGGAVFHVTLRAS